MNTTELVKRSHRLLVIDDNPRIHEDIKKILCPAAAPDDLAADAAALFGDAAVPTELSDFEIDSAYQGQEGLALVEKSVAEGQPYSMAFVDVRMPPGWDGIETIQHIWKCHPDLQVVICTAYSDHSWEGIIKQLGKSDSLLILKKPFDNVEVLQLAHALTKKWVVTRQAKTRLDDLEAVVTKRTAELVQANEQLQAEVERRAAIEQALRESEERFHKAFESASVGLAILRSKDLKLTDANQSFLALVGWEREAALLRTPLELQLAADTQSQSDLNQYLKSAGPVQNQEFNLARKNREMRNTLLSVVAIRLGDEQCLLLVIVDVTAQRSLEAQLRQSQKMEAIGQLAAGVAHDFNNLLTIIIGHAGIQLMKAGLDQEIGKSLEQVKSAGERASRLTRQLLAFSRKQVVNRTAIDINLTVRNMRKMLTRLVGETVTCEFQADEELPAVLADESNIEQVLLNLVVNARDAMPADGKIGVQVTSRVISETEAASHPGACAGKFVRLTVADNGTGMSPETLQRLFEPFFTTKPVGKGTGLGLSTVYGIIKQHDGWIDVQSKLGVGTRFHVYLPTTELRPEAMQIQTEHVARANEFGTVLVVEDEPQVRDYVCSVLRQAGYTTLDADCGPTALKTWEAFGEKVDLLLTDMVMPQGMTGGMLAAELLKQRPSLKVVYMSGYSAEVTSSNVQLREGINFLPKPFGQGRLLNMISRAFERSPVKVDTDRAEAASPTATADQPATAEREL